MLVELMFICMYYSIQKSINFMEYTVRLSFNIEKLAG